MYASIHKLSPQKQQKRSQKMLKKVKWKDAASAWIYLIIRLDLNALRKTIEVRKAKSHHQQCQLHSTRCRTNKESESFLKVQESFRPFLSWFFLISWTNKKWIKSTVKDTWNKSGLQVALSQKLARLIYCDTFMLKLIWNGFTEAVPLITVIHPYIQRHAIHLLLNQFKRHRLRWWQVTDELLTEVWRLNLPITTWWWCCHIIIWYGPFICLPPGWLESIDIDVRLIHKGKCRFTGRALKTLKRRVTK